MTSAGRYVLMGLAQARSVWFTDVAQWATSGALAAEFVKAVSVEEVEARLRSGRRFSALIVDASVPGWGRDTVELAVARGCAVVVVDDTATSRSWDDLGAHAALPAEFDRDRLVEVLRSVAQPITRADEIGHLDPSGTGSGLAASSATGSAAGLEASDGTQLPPPVSAPWRGHVVAVTGPNGTGRSTLAMALAAGLALDPRDRGLVVLADLALHAQLGLLHDAGDVVPGLVELVEAHRRSRLDPVEVRRLCFAVEDRGYDLLLGLRRHRDWTALKPRSTTAALDSLRSTYRLVVADIDAEIEGEAETGLVDIEDRNQLARITLDQADLVLVVGRAGLPGLHAQLRVLADLVGFGVSPARMVPVVNWAPRSRRRRAEIGIVLQQLLGDVVPGIELATSPVFVGERRRLDDVISDGGQLPPSLGGPVTGAVRALLDRVPVPDPASPPDRGTWLGVEPVAVAPGSVGSWTELTGEHAL